MHRSEREGMSQCARCGTEMVPGRERSYAYGENSFLCFQCALERGGRYDETQDRWSTTPDVEDLPPPTE